MSINSPRKLGLMNQGGNMHHEFRPASLGRRALYPRPGPFDHQIPSFATTSSHVALPYFQPVERQRLPAFIPATYGSIYLFFIYFVFPAICMFCNLKLALPGLPGARLGMNLRWAGHHTHGAREDTRDGRT